MTFPLKSFSSEELGRYSELPPDNVNISELLYSAKKKKAKAVQHQILSGGRADSQALQ